jgi:sporulation protein YlmC with PRC-barrel domain
MDDLLTTKDTLDLGLELLDRQLLDNAGEPCGRVDDLELELNDEGLFVTAILTNPGAFGVRIGGRMGRTIVNIWRRLHDLADPQPIRLPWSAVAKIDSAVHLNVDRDSAGLTRSERWARTYLERIPGL